MSAFLENYETLRQKLALTERAKTNSQNSIKVSVDWKKGEIFIGKLLDISSNAIPPGKKARLYKFKPCNENGEELDLPEVVLKGSYSLRFEEPDLGKLCLILCEDEGLIQEGQQSSKSMKRKPTFRISVSNP